MRVETAFGVTVCVLFIEVTVVSLGRIGIGNARITAVLVCTPLIKFSKCLFLYSSLSLLYACVAVSFYYFIVFTRYSFVGQYWRGCNKLFIRALYYTYF